MSEKKEPKRWVTVAGKHFPIYEDENGNEVFGVGQEQAPKVNAADLPDNIRRTYSRFIDDHSHDEQLDSDEKAWVEALRKEKYGDAEKAEEKKEKSLKPWSKAEEKRSREISEIINDKLRTGDWGEFYDTDDGETVKTIDFEIPGRRASEILISKNSIIYAANYDENDQRVKKGKSVKGTTHYTVSDDGETIDDSYLGYKTLADAVHAAELYMKDVKKTWK